ncbi:MAG: nucleotidyltransferase family protein [Marmoricola sp.]
MHPSPAAVRRVRSWVRGSLVLEAGREWRPEPALEPAGDLVEAVRRHRVAELVSAHADGLGLDQDVAGPVAELRTSARRAVMVQLLELERLNEAFGAAGLRCLALKGPALAAQTTGDPSARGSGDLDLLISPLDVEAACSVLAENGWRMRLGTEVSPGTWAWGHVMRSFNAFTFDGPGSTVDLHWRLDPTLDALPGFEDVWDRREPVDLGAARVETLGHADLLGQTSLHAAKDYWRWLRSLVDVHRIAADARTWDRAFDQDPLRRLEVETLAVTRFVVGLPDGVPDDVLAEVDRVGASVLTRALAAQERPVYAAFPFPGVESMRALRYMLAASTTARDRRHAAVATVLPVKTVVGIDARTAWTGVPLTLWHRVRRLRRRSVGWARREPGARVVEPAVRTNR